MQPVTSSLAPQDAVPELARRVGLILAALAALVAARFLRRPGLAGLIVPLWRRLTHVARRLRAAARPGRVCRPAGAGAAVAGEDPGWRLPAVRLPTGRGWLVRELGWEAVGFGSQLAAVLAKPEMQAALAALPRLGRVLRPVCAMLGLDCLAVERPKAANVARPVAARPAPVVAPPRVEIPGWERPVVSPRVTWWRKKPRLA